MKTIQYGGYAWTGDDHLYATINDKLTASTWEFGDIHQAVVYVKYNHLIEGKKSDQFFVGDGLGIGLRYGETREQAMQHCLDWIDQYQAKGVPTMEEAFQACYKYYPDLFPGRAAVLDHWFFVGGNGYGWLDGSIVDTSPDDRGLEPSEYIKELSRFIKEAEDRLAELGRPIKKDPPGILWEKPPYAFYGVHRYSKICNVPDDVKPEWLALAYEAALLLRDHSGVPNINSKRKFGEEDIARQEENRKIGADIVGQLERRFPHVKVSA